MLGTAVQCPGALVTEIAVALGGGDDTLTVLDGIGVPLRIAAGDGGDELHGSSSPEAISGGEGLDVIYGGGGNDELSGGTETDDVHGDAGDDTLNGGGDYDNVYGDDGDDRIVSSSDQRNDNLVGGAGLYDVVDYSSRTEPVSVHIGTPWASGAYGEHEWVGDTVERVIGGQGNDRLSAAELGGSVLFGGPGDDTLTGGNGDDALLGDAGNDLFRAAWFGAGQDKFHGGNGVDTVTYAELSAAYSGVLASIDGVANDGAVYDGRVEGDNIGRDVENIVGSYRPDVLEGDSGPNRLEGLGGTDSLNGFGYGDELYGGDGDDVLDGGAGGYDVLDGGADADVLQGGLGANDRVTYELASDPVTVKLDSLANDGIAGEGDNVHADVETVVGGPGGDKLTGDGAPNRFDGGDGDDTILGLGGDDYLVGEGGVDTLEGGDGDDDLFSLLDGAVDVLTCGGGGGDFASVDDFDSVASDCETVS